MNLMVSSVRASASFQNKFLVLFPIFPAIGTYTYICMYVCICSIAGKMGNNTKGLCPAGDSTSYLKNDPTGNSWLLSDLLEKCIFYCIYL